MRKRPAVGVRTGRQLRQQQSAAPRSRDASRVRRGYATSTPVPSTATVRPPASSAAMCAASMPSAMPLTMTRRRARARSRSHASCAGHSCRAARADDRTTAASASSRHRPETGGGSGRSRSAPDIARRRCDQGEDALARCMSIRARIDASLLAGTCINACDAEQNVHQLSMREAPTLGDERQREIARRSSGERDRIVST